MAPEAAIGQQPSEACDIWALGCVIYRKRFGEDIFLNYDTCYPYQFLQQIESTTGDLPDGWADVRFDDGWPTTADSPSPELNSCGFPRCSLEEKIFSLSNGPPPLHMNSRGEPETPAEDSPPVRFPDDGPTRVPYAVAYKSMRWKPTAVRIDGEYHRCYDDKQEEAFRGAYPQIRDEEPSLLLDLLSLAYLYMMQPFAPV